MKPRHFIDTQDFTPQELLHVIELAARLKEADKAGACPRLLEGASLGMLFEEPSTRTRVSFEVAMTKLGGHALYLRPGEIHLGQRESLADTANVLERMVDVIEARTLRHGTVQELARQADVPVINGLTDYNHPTQVLCDVFTMMEHAPGRSLKDIRVSFVGDATNVCNSLAAICTQMGMYFTQAAPAAYQLREEVIALAAANCRDSGGFLRITDDVRAAVADADFLYTDLWWWVGQESEIPERRAAFMPDYQLNATMLRRAPAHCRVMHCLPASRGVEATDKVLDSPQSVIFDQAENRLHIEKALLAWLVYPRLKRASSTERALHAERIQNLMQSVPSEVTRHGQ